jgi:hypothetical protein
MNGYPIPPERIAHYTCRKIAEPISVDGNLDKPVWQRAEHSRPFVDLVSGEPAFLETRMAALWDDENLYVGFWIQEPQVRAALTARDSFVWLDNDVEVFIDGEDCYYEFEINAFNTVYEALFIYQDALKRGGRFDTPEFDLYSRNAFALCFSCLSIYMKKDEPSTPILSLFSLFLSVLRSPFLTIFLPFQPVPLDQGDQLPYRRLCPIKRIALGRQYSVPVSHRQYEERTSQSHAADSRFHSQSSLLFHS